MVSYKYGGLIFICLIVGSIYFQIDSQKPEPPPKPMPEETIVVVGTCLEDHVLPKFTRKLQAPSLVLSAVATWDMGACMLAG